MDGALGRFEIERELGRGATGIVYLARDPQLNRCLALKLLVVPHTVPPAMRSQFVDRFLREARAAAAIRHPSVPQIYEVGEIDQQPYIAMEYCEGQTLRETLQNRGPLPVAAAVALVGQLLSTLAIAHELGITHRDVKPENIMLPPGDGPPKLMDFGIARIAAEGTMTATGSILGTPAYMSPEQVLGGTVDARSDLFSVGIVLHEAITGKRPFVGQTITQITHAIGYEAPQISLTFPVHLRPWLERALAKDPAARFINATAMATGLVEPQTAKSSAPIAPRSALLPPSAQPAPVSVASQQTMMGGPPAAPPRPLANAPTMMAPPPQPRTNLISCPGCGRGVSRHAVACPGCGHPVAAGQYGPAVYGKRTLPAPVQGLSWGAFFLTPFWAIANQVWIGLLCFAGFIPYLGWIIAPAITIYLLFKGNELAWTGPRQWRDEEEFQAVQAAWSNWGVGVFVVSLVGGCLLGILFGAMLGSLSH